MPFPRCVSCSDSIDTGVLCLSCQRQAPAFDLLVAEFSFDGPVRQAILRLKYNRARHLAPSLAQALASVRPDLPTGDLVVPIPLHAGRRKQRGYNQAELLARALTRWLDRPISENALSRVLDTPSQVSLPASQRWANVRNSFVADEKVVRGRQIVLVDDVATTTSTLRAAARALRLAGATRIEAIVLARATIGIASRGSGDAPI